ncbi:hydroxyacylglutathione hydrolase [Cutibacterium acnes JCM 18916]|jgi:glyoxylase-like metal-dependent hydrolase (beta-lactamase superfamily II)|nr:hydroxyacylglutathione hydrolase [Cutibacterium acnes JCM 18916]
MSHSLSDVVWSLDDSTYVLPGHGGPTTMANERLTNPFLGRR